jgi:hypothetical protein
MLEAERSLIVLFSVLIGLQQCLLLRLLRIFAAIQSKCLSMNHLHTKSSLSNQGQSRLIKVFSNSAVSNQDHHSTTPPLHDSVCPFHSAFFILHFAFPVVMLWEQRHGQAPFN